ncbi:2-amino-4-deoxychorismate dehydrogenase [bacterium BMS3Bbin14]|nr:2-amino-4-deoxychorismate dehydrogenase [bacterium BMS3Abin13]GBE53851.1 2-amino-4-deoxychorismate dehydrogenase [bacterium BMS3Bbin14]HDO30323.1 flavodoxin family protein [Desulfobacteraceae bacterium]
MTKILAINGSYRDGGITDQVVETMAESLHTAGAEVEIILLRNHPVEFCLNCRECTQQPGNMPGECVQHDGMQTLINKIEKSDGYILASPTNFGSVTAIFKRFMERLVVYAYWPWNMNAPQFRKANDPKKKAVLISSCAAPGVLGRWFFGTHKQLKTTAHTIGAGTVGTLFTGLIAKEPHHRLSERIQAKAKALAVKLV